MGGRFITAIELPTGRSSCEAGHARGAPRTQDSQGRFTRTPRLQSSLEPSCNTSARRIRSRTLGFSGSRASGFQGKKKRAPRCFGNVTSSSTAGRRSGAGFARPQVRLRRRLPCLGTFGVMRCHHPERTADNGGTALLGRGHESMAGVGWKGESNGYHKEATAAPHRSQEPSAVWRP